jgi:nucleoid-associated protein YgaU
MGLIDFVRSAGEKLFGTSPAAAGPTQDDAVLSKRAGTLEDHVQKLGLPVENLKIKVADEIAYVKGTVPTQDVREKIVLAVGNVEGIAHVDDRLEVTKPLEIRNPVPETHFYTVVTGDTLSKIAKAQYGDAGRYPQIFEANKPMLQHPDRIYPGQVLRIP